jgi:glycosyltransferase involved in cell wall biosynthesis
MHCQWLEQLKASTIERRINAADLMLGVSNFIAEGVRQRFPLLADRCSHIYNGTDVALFARPASVRPKPKELLYVGRLAPEKGIHVLLEAFRIVLERYPEAHLKLIGPEMVLFPSCQDPHVLRIDPYFRPGAYPDLLRSKISKFPPGTVSFLNKGVKFIELPSHHHSASIFVFPSVCEESFGMPLVEAMAAGTPVIATRGGAFPEIIDDGISGLLVERSDPLALAEAILKLLATPQLRDAMAQAAFQRASTLFSWERTTNVLVEKYEQLLDKEAARKRRWECHARLPAL